LAVRYWMYGMSMRLAPESWEDFQVYWERMCTEVLEGDKAAGDVLDLTELPKPRFAQWMPDWLWAVQRRSVARFFVCCRVGLGCIRAPGPAGTVRPGESRPMRLWCTRRPETCPRLSTGTTECTAARKSGPTQPSSHRRVEPAPSPHRDLIEGPGDCGVRYDNGMADRSAVGRRLRLRRSAGCFVAGAVLGASTPLPRRTVTISLRTFVDLLVGAVATPAPSVR
jgi:hypothetical protein